LLQQQWASVELHELISKSVIEPFAGDTDRVRMTGPETHLSPRATLIMSMALHELSTNAAKYGALSNSSGRVSIDWDTVEKTDGSKDFKFFWVESGGPTVSVPKERGFGSGLIERALATELGGVATLAFQPEGLGCQIRATLTNDLV
jgi:two-component sensor histidine kinase